MFTMQQDATSIEDNETQSCTPALARIRYFSFNPRTSPCSRSQHPSPLAIDSDVSSSSGTASSSVPIAPRTTTASTGAAASVVLSRLYQTTYQPTCMLFQASEGIGCWVPTPRYQSWKPDAAGSSRALVARSRYIQWLCTKKGVQSYICWACLLYHNLLIIHVRRGENFLAFPACA